MICDEKIFLEIVQNKLQLLLDSFEKVLYLEDENIVQGMKISNLAGDDIDKYKHWEWTHGVGLFGLWRLYEKSKDQIIWNKMIKYYENQIAVGLPAKNVNTTAPLLVLTYIYEVSRNEKYGDICKEWAEWLMEGLPKTKEGGFQHVTSAYLHDNELWDDTLFMAVLFLARMGKVLGKKEYIEEAKYQLMLHIKYLADRETGLWFHGWTFQGNHNFAKALWARGNCWITVMIPELLNIVECDDSTTKYFVQTLQRQIEALEKYQDESGMWHTLVDDASSYVEASATCGFGYGILRSVHMGIIDAKYEQCAMKALLPILEYINTEGVLEQVSVGTGMGTNKQAYKDVPIKPMPYGQALAILFLLESIKSIG